MVVLAIYPFGAGTSCHVYHPCERSAARMLAVGRVAHPICGVDSIAVQIYINTFVRLSGRVDTVAALSVHAFDRSSPQFEIHPHNRVREPMCMITGYDRRQIWSIRRICHCMYWVVSTASRPRHPVSLGPWCCTHHQSRDLSRGPGPK